MALLDPGPYLRGVAFAAIARDAGMADGDNPIPYPRQDPADFSRLPIDTWAAAQLPVGVRLEWTCADPVTVHYRTRTDDLGYRGNGAGRTFTVWNGEELIAEEPAVLGEGRVIVGGRPEGTTVVHLPEGMQPWIVDLDGPPELVPGPSGPRWLCYGDSIAEGWIAGSPAYSWPAITGRRHRLDTINLGFAGSARGETVSAEHLARLEGDVISLSHGTNCWNRIPHSAAQMRANTDAFLSIVRSAHPTTPILVVSPIVRPDAEAQPNALRATHADLRDAMEDAVRAHIAAGDGELHLLGGHDLLTTEMLGDGVHPNDEGHRRLADRIGPVIAALVEPQPTKGIV